MQSDPCGEASPKTGEGMRPLLKQGKSMPQFLDRRLRDLSHGRQCAPESLGPRVLGGHLVSLGRSNDLRAILPPPARVGVPPLEALVGQVDPLGGRPRALQTDDPFSGEAWVLGA